MTIGEVNYYTEDSDVTILGGDIAPEEVTQDWRPGLAGYAERVAMGSGDGNGWFIYFFERWLVVEFWTDGQWEFTRRLDCSALQSINGTKHRHVVAFGWNLESNMISLGCVSRDVDNPQDARIVHGDFYVRNLHSVFAHPERIYLGGSIVDDGMKTVSRALGATNVKSIGGRVSSRNPLTKGELARQSGREVRYAE